MLNSAGVALNQEIMINTKENRRFVNMTVSILVPVDMKNNAIKKSFAGIMKIKTEKLSLIQKKFSLLYLTSNRCMKYTFTYSKIPSMIF